MTTLSAPPAAPYEFLDAMLIGGRWTTGRGDAARPILDENPFSGDLLAEFTPASVDDVNAAYAAAAAAQPAWAATAPGARAALLRAAADVMTARRDEIIAWLISESGGTVAKSTIEFEVTRTAFIHAATLPYRIEGRILPSDVPGKDYRVYRRPVGVVGVISPWNFPLYLTNRTVAPALAAGNAIVLKPAEATPVSGALLLAKVLEEAGLPEGVLNVVVGRGGDIGDAMVEHPTPRMISFTGSTAVGEGVARKAGIKKLGLELGGNAPFVVLDDADLEHAAEAAVWGALFNQGQICMIANRVIVDASVHEDFIDRVVSRVGRLVIGDPSDPVVDLGPIVSTSQLVGIRDKIDRSVAAGAQLLRGGDPTGPTGLILPPHVLVGTPDIAAAQEEVFGPVITILRAADEAEALAMANDTEYGLTSAVFTRDLERGAQFALQIEAGMTHVNDVSVHDEPHIPFGGEKRSGIGRFGGDWILDEVTTEHLVGIQRQPRSYKL
jgi:aldehyde dehydrogenase (NAD+)